MTRLILRSSAVRVTAVAMVACAMASSVQAAACRDTPRVQESANPNVSTAMGGHMTQHIQGMAPPPGTSQVDKTLFAAKGKAEAAWRQYQYIPNPVNCSGQSAQQDVSLEKLHIQNLDALSCTQANANGECTKWNAYIAKSVFFGFVLAPSRQWIVNTIFPDPLP